MPKPEDGTSFLRKLAGTLKLAGFDAKVHYDSLVVGEVKYPAIEVTGQKDHLRVKFLDSSFKVTGTDERPDFDVSRAIGLVVSELPKRLEALAEAAVVKANVAVARSLAGDGAATFSTEPWDESYGTEQLRFAGHRNGIHITVVVPDEVAAREVLAKLRVE